MTTPTTPNLNLFLPNFNDTPWHDEINNNFRSIDATIKSIFGIEGLLGEYKNSTTVTTGQRYFDVTAGFYYEAQSDFTTLAAPNTFAQERAAYPTRWEQLDASAAIQSAQNAINSAAAALASQNAAATSAANAENSAIAAANSATSAANSLTLTQNATNNKVYAVQITDWNNALSNGWFNASGALNAPTNDNAWYIGYVEAHNDLWVTQTVHAFTSDNGSDTKTYRRDYNNGAFGSWYRLRLSVTEQEAVYRNAANLSSGVIPDARFEGARPVFGDLVGIKDSFSEDDFWLHANTDQFYILTDRDADGTWEVPHPARFNNTAANLHVYGSLVWTAANDGAGSGLDADLLDGLQSTAFARKDGSETFSGDITVNGPSIRVGYGQSGAVNSHVWFRDASNGSNYPFYYEYGTGRFYAEGRNGINGPVMIADANGYARNANVFRSENTGGRMWLNMVNQVDFHWNAGFYYRIDNNAYVLINSSPSDKNFKDRVDFAGHVFDEIKSVDVVRYTPKDGIPVSMPKGERDGFYAQDLANLDPNLIEEKPIPFSKEYELDESGALVLDKNGNQIAIPHELDGQTFLALAPDAQIQLIAKLWRAVRVLIERSEAQNDTNPSIDEAKIITLEDIKADALNKIAIEHARFLRKLTGGATIEERDTWQTKAIASEAYLAGTASTIQTDMLTSEASMTGETVDALAATVMAKYAAYHKLIGLASGAKRKAEAAINGASTPEEVQTVLQQTDIETKELATQWIQTFQTQ